MDRELKQALAEMETRIYLRLEATETKLLTAFHDWAQTNREDRLGKLERRNGGKQ